jgi:hypothetical protein
MNDFCRVFKLLVYASALLSPASLSKLSDVINPFFTLLRTIHSRISGTVWPPSCGFGNCGDMKLSRTS